MRFQSGKVIPVGELIEVEPPKDAHPEYSCGLHDGSAFFIEMEEVEIVEPPITPRLFYI